MKRRSALKNIAVSIGGVIFFPSCDFSKREILEAYQDLRVTDEDKNRIQSLSEIILPVTGRLKQDDIPEITNFILVIVNDCFSPEDKQKFRDGLEGFDDFIKKQTGKRFQNSDQKEVRKAIENLLTSKKDLAAGEASQEQISYFIRVVKDLTVQGYMKSEYYMTEVMPYRLTPGPFKGKIKIDESDKINIYD